MLFVLIYKNIPMQYTNNFNCKKLKIVFAQNIDCGYTLEAPRQSDSNEYPQSMFWIKNTKIVYPSFTMEKWVKGGYTLYGHVIMMTYSSLILENVSFQFLGQASWRQITISFRTRLTILNQQFTRRKNHGSRYIFLGIWTTFSKEM